MPWLKRDKGSLYYEEVPGGAPPMVFVHGLGCDHSFMAPQVETFAGTHRSIALDLPGHGRSDKPHRSYSIGAFADDLAWVLDALALESPVVVGHSMGGAIGLELAAQHPGRLAALVVLDTAVLPSPDTWKGVQPVIQALKSPGYETVARRFFADTFFLPTDDAARKQAIIDAMLSTPQHVLSTAFENIFSWDSEAAARRCQVPTLYLGSTRPRGDTRRFAELCPTLEVGQVVGAGHFLQLEVPDQVNVMIGRFLATYVPPIAAGSERTN